MAELTITPFLCHEMSSHTFRVFPRNAFFNPIYKIHRYGRSRLVSFIFYGSYEWLTHLGVNSIIH